MCLIYLKEKTNPTGKEINRGKQQNQTTTVELLQGIRLWFLPGVEEVLLEMILEPGEARFGMDIKRTDEVFKGKLILRIRQWFKQFMTINYLHVLTFSA